MSKTSFQFISLSLIAVLVIAANIAGGYWLFIKKPSPSASPNPSSSAVPVVTVDETELIKQAVYSYTGLNKTTAEININRNTGQHATGTIKEYEAVGGAYWLAARQPAGWIGVYAGQAQPECAKIEGYDFPKDMVPECLNSAGKVVKR